ncbi:eukaryotic translation initiation factor 4G-like isoform X2 [Alnus glutinosa]|uniref:eukaryotic translation initiation factor 4G-like isoform X2 n=1 Tax=Alnus glutinosa TaxID=3517 RepID=UPI002D76948F|nr:eukaryotic translation initiation factor 4G-like isoform X2 [Alnus glutinosa]
MAMGEESSSYSSYSSSSSNNASAIDSSNIGFQLLKKNGWKEGTGLGASEQGRLEPVQTYLKNNRRGLGADKDEKTAKKPYDTAASNEKNVLARNDSFRSVPPLPTSSALPASQQQKPPGLPMTGMSMPMPFHQSQVSVQYGGPNQQLQSQGMTAAASLQMPLHMPLAMGNPPQVQPPVFVQGLQPHPMQTRGIIHQGQGLSFTTQMGPPQLPPQLSSMGITMSPQYSQQQGGKFGVQRKTSVKITHLHHSNGSSQPIPSYAPSHTMSFYTPNSYNTSPIYYPPQSSVPLTSSPMAPSSQVPRFNYQVGQGPQNMTFMNPALSSLPVNKTGTQMHGVADLPNLEHSHDLHTIISSALSTTIPVTVKPSAGSIGEKVADSMRPNSTHGAEKGESPKHSVSIPSYGTKQLVIANPKSKIVQSAHCEVCKINCNSKCVLDTHKLGKKHKKNLEKLNKANEVTASAQSSAESDNPAIGPQEPPDIGDKGEAVDLQNSRKKAAEPVEDLETKRQKVLRGGAGAEVVWRCALCNVVCSSKTGFLSHLAGQKHALTINKHKLARKHKENLEKLNKANKAAAATYKNKATASAQSFAESNNPAIGPQELPDIGDKGEVVDLQNSRKKAAEPVEDLETKRRKVLQGGSVAEAVRTCNV